MRLSGGEMDLRSAAQTYFLTFLLHFRTYLAQFLALYWEFSGFWVKVACLFFPFLILAAKRHEGARSRSFFH
jgi:hypothetical protein